MLSVLLAKTANEYCRERAKSFTRSKFADFVRHDLAAEAKQIVGYWPFELTVKASVGQGVWASIPWLAFFDPIVTTSATREFYVVYLINPDSNTITLSMNQGATAIYQEFGDLRGRSVLKRRAQDIVDRIPEFAKLFSTETISLGSSARLPAGYEAGHAFGKVYHADTIEESVLTADLYQMLLAYEVLINRGGTTPSETMLEEAGSKDIEETRRYILSKRIERSPHVRKSVLKAKATKCECCGLDPRLDFSFTGPLEQTPLDVHHAAPLWGLSEGESRRYKIPDDFLLLCPTCHRMIHKLGDPSDLLALRKKLRFKIAREIGYFNS